MLRIRNSAQNRRELVKRLCELTGLGSVYTKAPRFAYEVGPYTVEQDGTLAVEEANADSAILAALTGEGLIDGVPAEPVGQAGPDVPLRLVISLPLKGHTGRTLRNLVNMVYSRGPLLSKATGGTLGADKELIDALDEAGTPESAEEFRALLEGLGGLRGLQILEDRICFTGFEGVEDSELGLDYAKLAAKMNAMALSQKYIQARAAQEENEKYSLRVWLIRLGINGPEFQRLRASLLNRLSGHTGWRTVKQAVQANARNAQKRREQKAQRAQEQEEL